MFLQNVTTGKIIETKFKANPDLNYLIKNSLEKFFNLNIKRKFNDGYLSNVIKDQKKHILKRFSFDILLKKLIYNLKNEFFLFRKNFSSDYYSINPYKLNFLTRKNILKRKASNLKQMFLKNQQDLANEKDFVYYALHFEPERTTNPDGGYFQDQFLALLTLRKIVPKNVLIYVKEHPSQFLFKKKGSLGRSPLFYELIKNIEGVRLINLEVDSYKMIKESKFVCTITGTVGLEAALMGNNALVFGDAWYKGCPNIIEWREDLTYEAIITSKNKEPKEITSYFNKFIYQYCFPGCINLTTQNKFPDFYNSSFKENEYQNILKSLTNLFINEKK